MHGITIFRNKIEFFGCVLKWRMVSLHTSLSKPFISNGKCGPAIEHFIEPASHPQGIDTLKLPNTSGHKSLKSSKSKLYIKSINYHSSIFMEKLRRALITVTCDNSNFESVWRSHISTVAER